MSAQWFALTWINPHPAKLISRSVLGSPPAKKGMSVSFATAATLAGFYAAVDTHLGTSMPPSGWYITRASRKEIPVQPVTEFFAGNN
jgi:hypothetical protein